jgi:16S rRNA processing protein RimM
MVEPGPRICVGRVGAPHGVRGDVRLWSFTEDPMAIAAYGVLEAGDGSRTLEIETLRPAKDFLVAHFKGVADRDDAARLNNLELCVPRDRLPEAEEDEFYHADLVGLAVLDRAGNEFGKIVAVHNFGASDVLELKLDGRSDTVLIPFTEATVPEIDISAGTATVELPAEVEATSESEA